MSTYSFTDIAVTGTLTGNRRIVTATTAAGPIALAAADSGAVTIATASSGTQTFTLPAASSGAMFTFVCSNASGEILVNPQTGETVSIKASEGGANVTTAAGTGIKNTAATNVKNDHITLVSDGGTAWYAISQSGTWASQ